MCEDHKLVSLGFSDKKVPLGSHICQIFDEDDERNESLLLYLLSGLQAGERTACFSSKTDKIAIDDFFSNHDVSYNEYQDKNAITLSGTTEVYFEDDIFDPERSLKKLSYYYQESLDLGFPAARVIGEMSHEVLDIHGGNRLLEYEARVSLLLEEHPVTTVCQYDATAFDGATIMGILKVHPQMIVKGAVLNNPFYISPEEFLKTQ